MKNILQSVKESKSLLFKKFDIDINHEEKVLENQADFLKYNILKNSQSLNLPDEFDITLFIKELEFFLKEQINLKLEISEIDGIKTYKYNETKGFKKTLGISGSFYLFLLIEKNIILYDTKPVSWLENWSKDQSKFNIAKIIQDSHSVQIFDFIGNYIVKTYFSDSFFVISENSRYLEQMNFKEKNWFLCDKNPDEVLLAFLNISAIKNAPEISSISAGTRWIYILTNESSKIIGFNDKSDIEYEFDISGNNIIVKNELGRDTAKSGEIEWLTNRNNKKQFHEIKDFTETENISRIYEFARLNWLNKEGNEKSEQYARQLIQIVKARRKKSFDEFSALYIDFCNENLNEFLSKFSENEKLVNLINLMVAEEDFGNEMILWADDWNITASDAYAIVKLFLNCISGKPHFEKLLPFHKKIREQVLKTEKDKINQIMFDIDYCKHLIKCDEKKDAIKILEKNLENLPDESLSELLPPKNIDITGQAAGQALRIMILEILAAAHDTEKTTAIIQQLTMLQPLSKKRLEDLIKISDSDLLVRTKSLVELLDAEKLINPNTEFNDIKYNQLGDKTIDEKLKHPYTRKGGAFSSIQSWLAKVKVPDYNIIKSYSDPLTSRNFPKINNIVTDIKVALNLVGVEIYIARGDKSVGINSFEGTPSFLIIGGDHLTEDSPYYMTFNELKFAIGVELSHLYFKHSRITSTDVWRGAYDKGTWVFDAVVSLLPVVGILGKSLNYVGKLNSLAQLLQKSETISKYTSKSQEVITSTTQAVKLYKSATKKDEKKEKELELLAISRILQLTADRAGLIFCGDIKSAIRSIFLMSKNYAPELSVVERYGISEFLLKKDDEGNYLHQELAIRFASLFAFYISEEFTQLRDKLIIKK